MNILFGDVIRVYYLKILEEKTTLSNFVLNWGFSNIY